MASEEKQSTFTAEVAPVLRPLSLEPTHVRVTKGDCAQAVVDTLRDLETSPTAYGCYQAYVNHDLVMFRVQISEAAAGDCGTVVQLMKFKGDTIAFIQLFVRFATRIKRMVQITPESETNVAEFAKLILHQKEFGPTRLADMDDVSDALVPVTAMMTSEWCRSRMEGFQTMATLSDLPENARILERAEFFTTALVEFERKSKPTDFKNPEFVRVFARVLANVLTWHQAECDPERTIVYERLFRRLVDVHDLHKSDSGWFHARLELVRLIHIGVSP